MPSQMDYRSVSDHSAQDLFAVMTDRAYLDARLAHIGGPGAGVLEYRADADGARFRVRHGLDPRDMPAIVRNLMPGDVAIERTETWTRLGDGRFDGEAEVEIQGTPASSAGVMRLRDLDAGGSELRVRMNITVAVPLLGGRIEAVIGDQVKALLASETEFTQAWLTTHR